MRVIGGLDTAGVSWPFERAVTAWQPDVVVAVQDGGVETAPGASPDEDRPNTLTYVLVKDDGEWRIASFHNARVSNPAD